MNKRISLLVVMFCAAMASCAQSPKTRYVQLSDAHTAITEEVTALSSAGVLTVKQVEVALALLQTADKRLDDYRNAVAREEDPSLLESILGSIDELIRRAGRIISEGSS